MNEEIVMHLSSAADRWERTHPIIGFGELRVHDALRDAVRCIKETSAKVPRWISVEERLPSQNGDYLIHYRFKNQGKGKGFYSVCFYERTCEKPHFHNEGYCGMYVTHWMPLPEPPKEGE